MIAVATARLNVRTCAPRCHRLGRIGIVRLSVLHYYLLTESEEETHARTHTKTKTRKKPNVGTQGRVMRMLDRVVIVGLH